MTTPRVILALVFTAACGFAAGCASHKQIPTTQNAEENLPKIHWQDQALEIKQEPVAVAQGSTPLAFIFATGGPIRVVDLTSGVTIASATVANQTLVRVDDRNGVIVNKVTVAPGPLPAGHQYAIYSDPTTANVMRHGIGPPAAPPTPPIGGSR